MKITLDSNEPLADALRVVGAMYNVDLSVSLGQRTRAKSVTNTATGKAAPKRANAQKVQSASNKSPTAAARPAKKTKGPKRQPVDRTNGSPGNAEIRSWAKKNGLKVKDRGRLPTSIIAAYRSTNSK